MNGAIAVDTHAAWNSAQGYNYPGEVVRVAALDHSYVGGLAQIESFPADADEAAEFKTHGIEFCSYWVPLNELTPVAWAGAAEAEEREQRLEA